MTFYLLITGIIGGFQVFVEVSVMTTNGGINYSKDHDDCPQGQYHKEDLVQGAAAPGLHAAA